MDVRAGNAGRSACACRSPPSRCSSECGDRSPEACSTPLARAARRAPSDGTDIGRAAANSACSAL
jgi:hypothetical protein